MEAAKERCKLNEKQQKQVLDILHCIVCTNSSRTITLSLDSVSKTTNITIIRFGK